MKRNDGKYHPFRWGVERGSDSRCPACGVAKANQHSLSEAGYCDGKKRPKVKVEGEAA